MPLRPGAKLGLERRQPCAVRVADRFEFLPETFQLLPDLLCIRRRGGGRRWDRGGACCDSGTAAAIVIKTTAANETARRLLHR